VDLQRGILSSYGVFLHEPDTEHAPFDQNPPSKAAAAIPSLAPTPVMATPAVSSSGAVGSGATAPHVPHGGAIAQTHEFKELKRRLHCEVHGNRPGCRINGETSEHVEVDWDELSLWALMIVSVVHLVRVLYHLISHFNRPMEKRRMQTDPLIPQSNPFADAVAFHRHVIRQKSMFIFLTHSPRTFRRRRHRCHHHPL